VKISKDENNGSLPYESKLVCWMNLRSKIQKLPEVQTDLNVILHREHISLKSTKEIAQLKF
jgi:hypothetical protein